MGFCWAIIFSKGNVTDLLAAEIQISLSQFEQIFYKNKLFLYLFSQICIVVIMSLITVCSSSVQSTLSIDITRMARVFQSGQGRGGRGGGGRGGVGRGGVGRRGGGRGGSRGPQQNQGRKNRQPARPPPQALSLLDQQEGLDRRVEMVLVENSYTIPLREWVIGNITPALLKENNWTHTDFIGWDAGVLLKVARQILRYPIAGLAEHKRAETIRAVNDIIGLRIKNAHSLIRALLIDAVIGHALDNLEIVVNNLLIDGHWQLIQKTKNKIEATRFLYGV